MDVRICPLWLRSIENLKHLIVLSLCFFSGLAVARKDRSINFVTGVPLTASPDPTGGFGDIAANVVTALEFKKRFPQMKIRLIVTSVAVRTNAQVPTTNEIILAMMPHLRPEHVYVPQSYGGVEIIFTEPKFSAFSVAAMAITDRGGVRPPADLTENDIKELMGHVPSADYAIQLSGNHTPMQALPALGRVVLSVGEHEFKATFLDRVLWGNELLAPNLFLNSGVNALGTYLVEPKSVEHHRRVLLENLGLRRNSHLLFAYSKYPKSTQLYIDALAIALKGDRRRYDLIVKNFSGLDFSQLPSGIQIHQRKSLPHEAVEALYHLSALSPLGTGDVSTALEISYTSNDRAFVIEVPEWKEGHCEFLKSKLASALESGQERWLDAVFLNARELAQLKRGQREWDDKVTLLANTLQNKSFNASLNAAIGSFKSRWDMVSNLGRVFNFLEAVDFVTLGEAPQAMIELGISVFQDGNRGEVVRRLRSLAASPSSQMNQKYYALLILLRMGAPLEDRLFEELSEWLISDDSLDFNPWRAVIEITPSERITFLNRKLNERYRSDKITPFKFLRAKLTLPSSVLSEEKGKIDYGSVFRKYLENPVTQVRWIERGGNSFPIRSFAIDSHALASKFIEVSPTQFYQYYGAQLTMDVAPLRSEVLIFLQVHNRYWKGVADIPKRFASVVDDFVRLTLEAGNQASYSRWTDVMAEAVEALRGLPVTESRIQFIEEIIQSGSQPKACEIAVQQYPLAAPSLKRRLAVMVGICIAETSDTHHPEVVKACTDLLYQRIQQDPHLRTGVIEATRRELSLWGQERISVAAAAGYSSFAAVPEPLKGYVKNAASLRFSGMPDQARKLVNPGNGDSCAMVIQQEKRRQLK